MREARALQSDMPQHVFRHERLRDVDSYMCVAVRLVLSCVVLCCDRMRVRIMIHHRILLSLFSFRFRLP